MLGRARFIFLGILWILAITCSGSAVCAIIERDGNSEFLASRPRTYRIRENSRRATLNERPFWPPLSIYVYPENHNHTTNCLYTDDYPSRYVQRIGFWFQRMLEPVVHHQFLDSPIRTEHPEEADLFFIPHYSRMCSGVSNAAWDNIPKYLASYGSFYKRYHSIDHIIMHSVPCYGDKPADQAVRKSRTPIIAMLDFNAQYAVDPWMAAKSMLVPFVTGNVDDAVKAKRNTSLFVAMSTSTKGLAGSSARLRQAIQTAMNDIKGSLVHRISRRSFTTFKKAMYGLTYWMSLSDMCLVPPGDAPSSKRFYDAIASYCIPYLVSDHFMFPYEDIYVDYATIVKQLPSKMIANMSNDFDSISDAAKQRMRESLVEVRKRFAWDYEERPKTGQALWTMSWALFDKSRMLKPYQNNEMTGNDNDIL